MGGVNINMNRRYEKRNGLTRMSFKVELKANLTSFGSALSRLMDIIGLVIQLLRRGYRDSDRIAMDVYILYI